MPTLSEHESKRLLAGYGVAVAPERLVATPAEAADAAVTIGFPVAVKLCGASIAHKTERGLVRLGLRDADAVREAADAVLAAATPADGEVGVLVAGMVRGNRELIAGVVRDPQFGPCVMLGVGGILAEAVHDVAFRLAPLERVDAEDLLDGLRSQALLGPFRGEPAIDREHLVGLLVGLGRLAAERDDVLSVDLNPLIVADGLAVAVDALVEVSA